MIAIQSPFDTNLMRRAAAEWPAPDWPHWHRYDSPLERKRACNDWAVMPPACRELLGQMMLLPVADSLGMKCCSERLIPDATLWGGGMHDMGRGDHLDLHLDADRHPRMGLERRTNAILFLGEEWEPSYGGELEFWTADKRLRTVSPAFGRLVCFATTDASYHGIPAPLSCPAHVRRKSLAVFWFSRPRGTLKRPRAQFVALPGEQPDPAREALREQRCFVGT